MKEEEIMKHIEYCEKNIYNPLGFELSKLKMSDENNKYGSCTFKLNKLRVQFRIGKITDKKIGHFVTLWKRENDITTPYDKSDKFDVYIISVIDKSNFGQFWFTKDALLKNKILSDGDIDGKRGFRLYAPWYIQTKLDNKTAKDTAKWQSQYFVDLRVVNGNPNDASIKFVKKIEK